VIPLAFVQTYNGGMSDLASNRVADLSDPTNSFSAPAIVSEHASRYALGVDRLELRLLAEQIFLKVEGIDLDADPEIENCPYLVVRVIATDDAANISALRREWYRRTQDVFGDLCRYIRLDVDVRT
jgi:hypothetical protein